MKNTAKAQEPPHEQNPEPAKPEKPATVRFTLGTVARAEGGQVTHSGKLWSKEVQG